MIKDISSVKIGAVWNAGRGGTFREEIQTEADFPGALRLTSSLGASLLLIRMKDGVSVVLSDLKTSVEQICARCLESFDLALHIAQMEAHFYDRLSPDQHDQAEQFPIRRQDMSIDLTEAIRQEIILHFPLIPVCSKRCKGLCSECHAHLNSQPHGRGCSQPADITSSDSHEDVENRPFANLKDYFQN